MKTKTIRAQKILDFIQEEIPKQESRCKAHGIDHILRVWQAGLIIGEAEKANLETLEPALLLHDIIRPSDEEGEKQHAVLSANHAKDILKDFNYQDEEIKEICEAIKTHSRSSKTQEPKTLEAKIVYDADKQDGVGEIGVKRAIALGKGRNWTLKQTAEWYLKRICDVIKNQPFFTEEEKKLANKKIVFAINWCQENLDKETLRKILDKFNFKDISGFKV